MADSKKYERKKGYAIFRYEKEVVKDGKSSLKVRLPKDVAQQMGFYEGTKIWIIADPSNLTFTLKKVK